VDGVADGAVRFAVLGDSLSEGVGDPLPGGGWRGWAALLGESLTPRGELLNLARSGARSGDVAGSQLTAALRHRPQLASVVVGGNDTLRGGFDIAQVAADLHTAIGTLRASGAHVLTACLPDPGTVLGLPWPLAHPLGRRMAALNDTVHALSAHHGTVHLHAARLPWTTSPGVLSADRLHPSEAGHRMMARDFHLLLAAADAALAAGPGPRPTPDGPAPGRAASVWWMATRGTRWIADRCTDLLPDLLRLAAEEYRHAARGTAPLLDHAAREATALALESLGLRPDPAIPPPGPGADLVHSSGRPERSATKRILVPGADWAAAGSDSSGTTPITG
jgi:lysophospholipase L1-like esterase